MSAPLSLSRRFLLRVMGAEILAPALRTFGRGLLSIFTLHRFAAPSLGVGGHDPALLRDHLAYLRRHRYRLLSLTDVVGGIENGGRGVGGGGGPAVAFTVDDGYAGFARIAAPIFAEYDCPVTLFVTTGFLDGQLWFWWDRVTYLFTHTQRSSLVLDLGAQERSYQWSTSGERDQAQHDLLRRLEWIDPAQREATQRMGFRAALTTVRSYAATRHARPHGALERFALPRFPYPDDTPHFVNVVAGLARLKQRLHRLHGGVLRPRLTLG